MKIVFLARKTQSRRAKANSLGFHPVSPDGAECGDFHVLVPEEWLLKESNDFQALQPNRIYRITIEDVAASGGAGKRA